MLARVCSGRVQVAGSGPAGGSGERGAAGGSGGGWLAGGLVLA